MKVLRTETAGVRAEDRIRHLLKELNAGGFVALDKITVRGYVIHPLIFTNALTGTTIKRPLIQFQAAAARAGFEETPLPAAGGTHPSLFHTETEEGDVVVRFSPLLGGFEYNIQPRK